MKRKYEWHPDLKSDDYYCPYCGTKLPTKLIPAPAIFTEATGQKTTLRIEQCPKGCMEFKAKETAGSAVK